MMEIRGDLCHELLLKKTEKQLAFNENNNYQDWKKSVSEKLTELLGMKEIEANACPLQLTIEEDVRLDGYRRIRFVFESERGAFVPCYLSIPDTGKEKYPLMISLQGHSSGFHNDIGVPKEGEEPNLTMARSLQSVQHGFAALTIEQRGMGERLTNRARIGMCSFVALTAFQMGRTILGERVWDVQRAIDLLGNFPQIDTERIAMTGGSGGGTATFYTACMEERIKFAIPAYAFCSYETSIMDIHHCACNYIPHSLQWFEMEDLACLIAPRKLLVVTGREDKIFPIHGVENSYRTVEKIFEKAGVKDNCRLLVTPKGHFWMTDLIWEVIQEETEKLGWKK